MRKQLLIITGPQGSGNHLFAKVLSLHPDVFGWNELVSRFWVGHHDEPFARYWEQPSNLRHFDWDIKNHYVTSISCPYVRNRVVHYPEYADFIRSARSYAEVSVAIIGRDPTIIRKQQSRVRGLCTIDDAVQHLKLLMPFDPIFISQELLNLYRQDYLQSLKLPVPVAWDDPRIEQILDTDANEKYIHDPGEQPLDKQVRKAVLDS